MVLRRVVRALIVLSLVLPAVSSSAAAQGAEDEITRDTPYVPGEVVVAMAAGKTLPTYAAEAVALGRTIGGMVRAVARDGTALLKADPQADVLALAAKLASQPGIRFAEPNYVYWIPKPAASVDGYKATSDFVVRQPPKGAETNGKDRVAIPIPALQAMKSKRGSTITATYPNDPYLWLNGGWDIVEADIVWPLTTSSAGVCVVDTGVDYLHPDLSGKVVKGYDYVNADADPMDDNGHGTHVAGIVVAKGNNRQGMSGVSTGIVVAVKVLSAQGWGTSYDVAQGINFCANRIDLKVINLSLGGPYPSTAIQNALNYAVNTKGKLVVAAAGNDDTDSPAYPAYYATYPAFADKVLAVAASGLWYEDPPGSDTWWLDWWCRADYSNYGSWVTVVAPGTETFSTTPWDKPFYLNFYEGVDTRYGYLDGTSMATPFVSASSARRWGYKPTYTNAQIGADVKSSGAELNADDSCWPTSMSGKRFVNVATLLDRGSASGAAYDASTGTPLVNAQIQAYQTVGTSTYLRGTGVLTTYSQKAYPWEADPARVYMWFSDWTDIINLPAGTGYTFKVSHSYTAGAQPAFQDPWGDQIYAGQWSMWVRSGVPPKSGNFDAVVHWWRYDRYDIPVFWPDPDGDGNWGPWPLDVNVWLPNVPNPVDPSQPSAFIVGREGNAFGYLEGDPSGALTVFPFARWQRDAEGLEPRGVPVEDTTILKRLAHAPLPANSALPYYPGDYYILVTDCRPDYWDEDEDLDYEEIICPTIDHDNDDLTAEIPLLGVYMEPHLYIWKDGVIKLFVGMPLQDPYGACNTHWWKAAKISSGVSGAPTYTPINECGDSSIVPYSASEFGGQIVITK